MRLIWMINLWNADWVRNNKIRKWGVRVINIDINLIKNSRWIKGDIAVSLNKRIRNLTLKTQRLDRLKVGIIVSIRIIVKRYLIKNRWRIS